LIFLANVKGWKRANKYSNEANQQHTKIKDDKYIWTLVKVPNNYLKKQI